MTDSSIFVVCTANICRSPVGAALLAHALTGTSIAVTSAGTHAITGREQAPQATSYIYNAIHVSTEHRARQLKAKTADDADLILTMTEEQRAWVTNQAPRTLRRTYTMLEYARLLRHLEDNKRYPSLARLVHASTPMRGRINAGEPVNDIIDPFGGSPKDYEASFSLIQDASRTIAAEINEHVRGGTQ